MGIQVIKSSVDMPLQTTGPVGIPLSEPACVISAASQSIPGKEEIKTGIWECSVGMFRREIAEGEVMHIMRGRCSFTPDGEDAITLMAGDTVFLPPNTNGVWDIVEPVRKVYVLV